MDKRYTPEEIQEIIKTNSKVTSEFTSTSPWMETELGNKYRFGTIDFSNNKHDKRSFENMINKNKEL